jgi:hypothetical protein
LPALRQFRASDGHNPGLISPLSRARFYGPTDKFMEGS